MSDQSGGRTRPTRDFDAEGRPLARQEDEAAGTGARGVDVGRPDAMPPGEGDDRPFEEEQDGEGSS